MVEYILEMSNITKEFPGVKALENVNFRVKRGEIHALVGENGAGKSTLMKVLSGVYPFGTYSGDIILNGEVQKFSNIKDSERAGIAIIYQELALIKEMTVCENIFLGNEIAKRGIINWDKALVDTDKLLKEVGINIDPNSKIVNLGIGQQQLVEIVKAIAKKADLLILDEPTAALTETESENLLNILKDLKDKGVTCIYISHKLNEVMHIADSITVLRDGKTICTENKNDMDENKIISRMVGRELTQRFPRKEHKAGETVLEIKNWKVYNPDLPGRLLVDDVSFSVKKGEILGISGLMGAGRTELVTSIFGAMDAKSTGELYIDGKKVEIKNPREAIGHGLCYLSEDRKQTGLVLMMDIKNNMMLSSLKKLSKLGVINENEAIKHCNKLAKDLRIKTPSLEQEVCNLSGGNQQKVVLGKWLMANPKVLILDEPTRGIDVGAKYEIYNIMNELVEKGVCIIMISSELPEVLGMSDRVLVIHEGRLSAEIDWKEATPEKVINYATGGK